ncbi:hypothetical protein AA0482_1773 [Acetobacter cibinongensis NRIC 0482]|nr:hypothetical protein AA0482_1773 [Acetobacter cibinongensis NRIC 0482]
MNNGAVQKLEALHSLLAQLGQYGFGHAGVMLKRQAFQPITLPSDLSDKKAKTTNTSRQTRKSRGFLPNIEPVRCDNYAGHWQPSPLS